MTKSSLHQQRIIWRDYAAVMNTCAMIIQTNVSENSAERDNNDVGDLFHVAVLRRIE